MTLLSEDFCSSFMISFQNVLFPSRFNFVIFLLLIVWFLYFYILGTGGHFSLPVLWALDIISHTNLIWTEGNADPCSTFSCYESNSPLLLPSESSAHPVNVPVACMGEGVAMEDTHFWLVREFYMTSTVDADRHF